MVAPMLWEAGCRKSGLSGTLNAGSAHFPSQRAFPLGLKML
jgi:hypothetical protein